VGRYVGDVDVHNENMELDKTLFEHPKRMHMGQQIKALAFKIIASRTTSILHLYCTVTINMLLVCRET
jgi:hypothetical protein